MRYEGDIYRPPSEAASLILQVTVGCTHNKCTFCSMYKADAFKVKPLEAVLADLREARAYYRRVERIFLADGDALFLPTPDLERLLEAVRQHFPECTRVGIYGRASHILRKSGEELARLRELGLGICYVGAESGSNEVLRRVQKNESAEQIVEAVRKAESAGIKTSVTFISGLGGRELREEHAVKTGEMISALGASYVGFLTLLVDPAAPLYEDIRSGTFELLTPQETLEEMETVLLHTHCSGETVFRSNHASNWLSLSGTLPRDRDRMLEEIRRAKSNADMLRSQEHRRL